MIIRNGHVSPETALLAFHYPMGGSLRGVQRTWIETATKGSGKGQQRMVEQTTHKVFNQAYTQRIAEDGIEHANIWAAEKIKAGTVWNNPKASTYGSLVVITTPNDGPLSPENRIQRDGLNLYSGADDFAKFREKFPSIPAER
jgi:hypothetical protein